MIMIIKRLTPLFILLTISLAFIAGQVLFKEVHIASEPSPGEEKSFRHYEAVFEQTTFEDLEGNQIKLSEIKAPVVILNFWASWCTPCLVEFPSLVEMNNKFSESEVKVIGINTDSDNQELKMKRIIEDYKLNFVNIPDKDSEIVNQYLVRAIPVSIIFHRGKVVRVTRGHMDFVAIEFLNQIRRLIKS